MGVNSLRSVGLRMVLVVVCAILTAQLSGCMYYGQQVIPEDLYVPTSPTEAAPKVIDRLNIFTAGFRFAWIPIYMPSTVDRVKNEMESYPGARIANFEVICTEQYYFFPIMLPFYHIKGDIVKPGE